MNDLRLHYPHLNQLRNVVAIGGGHGLGRVLSSLAFLEERLTGIVTTTDNGGSTGRIRAEHGGIAWGDLRNCLTQIIEKPTVASALFEYRFAGKGELGGHNLGNLILKALEDMHIRPLEALNLVRNLLGVKVQLMPMSEIPVHLAGTLSSGASMIGEVLIDSLEELPISFNLVPNVSSTPEMIDTLEQAELIILGPGSFFTSIMPPLLLAEVRHAILHSNASVIFIDNLGREHGIAGTLSLAERVAWLERQLGSERLNGVITVPEEQRELPPHLQVLRQDLHADDVSYRHDRQKLAQAIHQMLTMLPK